MGRLLSVPSHRWYRNGREYTRFTISFSVLSRAALVVPFPFGVPGVLFHDVRRPVARNLRRAGMAESVIMKIGGWRSVFEGYAFVFAD